MQDENTRSYLISRNQDNVHLQYCQRNLIFERGSAKTEGSVNKISFGTAREVLTVFCRDVFSQEIILPVLHKQGESLAVT